MFVVGDRDQAIYAWRGADYRNQQRFDSDFQPTLYHLSENYRSRQSILNAAHDLILPNYRHEHREDEMRPLQGLPDGAIRGIATGGVSVILLPNANVEAKFIAQQILHRKMGPEQSVAVLLRTNAQTRPLEREFVRESIPHVVVNGTRFFQRREIVDTIAYLKIVLRPLQECASVQRVINVPPRHFGDQNMQRLEQFGKVEGLPLWSILERLERKDDRPESMDANMEMLHLTPRGMKAALQFYGVINRARHILFADNGDMGFDIREARLSDLIRFFLQELKYEEWIKYDDEDGVGRWTNIRELCNIAADYPCTVKGLEVFIDDIALMMSMDKKSIESNHDSKKSEFPFVKILTIHAAKGSEFDHG